ncbi:hypothetical protein DPMN_178431 [Dreissena polymorpha]|uniref:Uncharacterized protein n=1 Tax=Dreissena polymorpha TaxID=45954 RepID=A0A9D4EAW7_DREPO|nr:hypothetical protein DPMN_178431 [Dreissena polymorpha]
MTTSVTSRPRWQPIRKAYVSSRVSLTSMDWTWYRPIWHTFRTMQSLLYVTCYGR